MSRASTRLPIPGEIKVLVASAFVIAIGFGLVARGQLAGQRPEHRFEAAHAVGLPHLVFTSVGDADKNTGIPHFARAV